MEILHITTTQFGEASISVSGYVLAYWIVVGVLAFIGIIAKARE